MSIASRLAWRSRLAPRRLGMIVVRHWRIALCVAGTACFSAADAAADYPHVSKFIAANPNAYTVANRPFGEDFILEDIPVGTRVIYPNPPIKGLPNREAAIRYAVNKGIIVVQLSPAVMEFRKPVNMMSLMFAIVELSRGHSESAIPKRDTVAPIANLLIRA